MDWSIVLNCLVVLNILWEILNVFGGQMKELVTFVHSVISLDVLITSMRNNASFELVSVDGKRYLFTPNRFWHGKDEQLLCRGYIQEIHRQIISTRNRTVSLRLDKFEIKGGHDWFSMEFEREKSAKAKK